jgi:hypothetical protein
VLFKLQALLQLVAIFTSINTIYGGLLFVNSNYNGCEKTASSRLTIKDHICIQRKELYPTHQCSSVYPALKAEGLT